MVMGVPTTREPTAGSCASGCVCWATIKITQHAADRPPKQFDDVERNNKSEAVQSRVHMSASTLLWRVTARLMTVEPIESLNVMSE
jgi:hypothetical protein